MANREVFFIDTAGGQTSVAGTGTDQLFTAQAAIVGAPFITAVGGFPTDTFELTEAGTLFIQGSVGVEQIGPNGSFRMVLKKQALGVGLFVDIPGTFASSGQLDNGDGEEGNVTSFCLVEGLATDRFMIEWSREGANGQFTTLGNYSRIYFAKKS